MTDLLTQLQATLGDGFSIERELGGGGMSRVFLARDDTLGRDVVVKVIAPENAEGLSAERFAREVKLAARLQQANIVPVLAAGTSGNLPYYTMPFVRGESLRARLGDGKPVAIAEAVSILRDVARALAYAHAEGVVHRDIKPENILLSGGAAVVTDFGIAKAMVASRTLDGGNTTGITRVGVSLGTPAYMSPEQALGDPAVDFRADIYSWGVVAWELLGGGHPFAGRTTVQALIAAHVAETPPSLSGRRPEVPSALAQLVMRCLDKTPANRPASASELLVALDSVNTSGEKPASPLAAPLHGSPHKSRRAKAAVIDTVLILAALGAVVAMRRSSRVAAAAAGDKSLAILPLVASGGDTANSYLGEGIAEDVSNSLAQVPGLRLAGRSSASRIAHTGMSVPEIAKSLGVGDILDGTVRRVGDRIRVAVELTSGADANVIWRESYDRPAKDIFAVQEDIARAIAGQLQVLTVEPNYLDVRMADVLPHARAAAERAVRLDSTLAEAHLALGYVLAESFDWTPAEAELRRAIDLDPGAAEPRYRLGYLMVNMRRPAEAIPVLQQGKARDPMYFLIAAYLGSSQILVGQVGEGLAEEQRGLELEPDNIATLSTIARGYVVSKMPDSAKAVARRLLAVSDIPGRRGIAANVLAHTGERREAEAVVRELEALPEGTWTRSTGLAIAYLGTGDTARAESYMGRAATGDGNLFVLYSTLLGIDIPRDSRTDAVWRFFHLDPARMVSHSQTAHQ